MKKIGVLNERNIEYLSIDQEGWQNHVPHNWLAFIIINEQNQEIADLIANFCLKHKPLYVCAVGKFSQWMETHIDLVFVKGSYWAMTTSGDDIKEELWFAADVAFPPEGTVESILCINTDKNIKEEYVVDLISQIAKADSPASSQEVLVSL